MCGLFVLLFCVCVTGFSPSSIHPHPHESMCTVCVCVQCVCGVHGDAVPAASQEKREEKRGERRREKRRAANQQKQKNKREREQREKKRAQKNRKNRKTAVRLLRVSQCRRHSIGGAALLLSATFIPTGSRPLSSRLDRGS